jgi:diguanylate cyclase (GGDEF)-like protein
VIDKLNIVTLAMITSIVNLAQQTALIYTWKTQKTYPGFGTWIVALLFYFVGSMLTYVFRGRLPAAITIIGGNCCFIVWAMLIYQGMADYCGLSRRNGVNAFIVVLVTAASWYFTVIRDDINARSVVNSIALGVIFLRTAVESLIGSTIRYSIQPLVSTTMLGFSAAVLLRGADTLLYHPFPNYTAMMASDDMLRLVLLTGLFMSIIMVCGFISMSAERVETQLRTAQEEAEQLALQDPLTGLANRRMFEIGLAGSLARARRFAAPFCVLVLDIDHFKNYNDNHGHAAGDKILKQTGDLLAAQFRETDLAVRYGGEEFVVLLNDTKLDEAQCVAEKAREAMLEHTGVTVSIGVAEYDPGAEVDSVFRSADRALYEAKNKGRNRVAVAA